MDARFEAQMDKCSLEIEKIIKLFLKMTKGNFEAEGLPFNERFKEYFKLKLCSR